MSSSHITLRRCIITSAKKGYVFTSACLSVSLCAILLKVYERILMNFWGLGRGQRNNRLDFGGKPDHDPDPGIFKGYMAPGGSTSVSKSFLWSLPVLPSMLWCWRFGDCRQNVDHVKTGCMNPIASLTWIDFGEQGRLNKPDRQWRSSSFQYLDICCLILILEGEYNGVS